VLESELLTRGRSIPCSLLPLTDMAGFRHRKGIEVGCLFRKFLTSASFTTLRLDDHDVTDSRSAHCLVLCCVGKRVGDLDCRIADRQVAVSNQANRLTSDDPRSTVSDNFGDGSPISPSFGGLIVVFCSGCGNNGSSRRKILRRPRERRFCRLGAASRVCTTC